MTVKFNFPERYGALLIVNAIQHANLKEWAIINAGKDKINITEKDRKDLDIKFVGTNLQWNAKKGEEEVKFDLDEQFIKMLKEKIKTLDSKNMIPKDVLPLAVKLQVE